MSWTSEFELPPQGPQVSPDDAPSAEEDDAADAAAIEPEPELEPAGPGFELSDIPDEGPLDPSVFDGLFTDLTDADEDSGKSEDNDVTAQPDDHDLTEQDALYEDALSEDEAALGEADTDAGHEDTESSDVDVDDVEFVTDNFEDTELEAAEFEDTEFEDTGFEEAAAEQADAELDNSADEQSDGTIAEDFDELLEDDGFDEEVLGEEELDQDELDEPAFVETAFDDEAAEFEPETLDLEELEAEEFEAEEFEPVGLDPEELQPEELELEDLADGGFKLFDPAAVHQPQSPAPSGPIIDEPLPAVATSPPIALDDPYADQNGYAAPPYHEVPAAAVVDQLNPGAAAPPKRRWPAFVTAIVIGGTLGIGGAVLLTSLQNSNGQDDEGAQAPLVANEVTNDQAIDGATATPETSANEGSPTTSTSLLADGQLMTHAVDFVPGTTELTETGQATLQLVAASVAELPPEPTAITVRTFTQQTAEANRQLSEQQAAAVGDYLASLGVEFGGLSLRGVGAAPLAPAMPVENFVVARASLRTSALKEAVAAIGPFEIGVDPDSLQLRPESIRALATIGNALSANADGSISLAGYSYDRPTDEANKAMAAAAVDAAREYLTTTHQIDPARLLVLAPGALPYVLGPEQGGHVEIKRGRSVAVDVAVHSVEQPLVSFASGSDALSGAAAEELSRIANLLIDAQAQAVISVRSSGEPSADANSRLSALQAEAIASFLADTGLAEGQVRVYGVGDVERLRSDTTTSEVTITVLP